MAGKDGHFSSFVNSKADSIAPTPGTMLASPLLPLASNPVVLNPIDTQRGPNDPTQSAPLQVAAYSPPVLFGQTTGQIATCRP